MSRLDAEIEILQNDTVADRAAVFAEDPAGYGSNERSNYAGKAYVSPRYVSPAYNNGAYTKGSTSMGIFSRTRDIIAANFNDMLEKAEDPAKMIRLIILEMEETLVEVRTSSARTIADQKEMRRHVGKLDRLQADWGEKAQLALSKDREDLARAALLEKKKAADMGVQLAEEIAILDDALRAYEQDIEKLQSRLREARARQSSIAARLQSAENRVKLRTLLSSERVDDAMQRFDQLERRVDYAEGRADALSLGDDRRQPTLSEEIAALADGDKIDAELAQMKQAMSGQPRDSSDETKPAIQ
jgi:phage shock protein A